MDYQMGPSGMKAQGLGVKNLNKTTTNKMKNYQKQLQMIKNVQHVKQKRQKNNKNRWKWLQRDARQSQRDKIITKHMTASFVVIL